MTQLSRSFDRVVNFLAGVVDSIILIIPFLTGYSVVTRYVFKNAQTWVLEITQYSLVFITFLGAAWLLREGGMVAIDFFISYLKPRGRIWQDAIVSFIGTVTSLLLFWYSLHITVDYALRGLVKREAIDMPVWILLAPIALGFLFTSFVFIRQMYRDYRELGKKQTG